MKHQSNRRHPGYWLNLAIAAVAGMSGCASLVILGGGLFLGLYLDNLFESSPLLAILAVILSVPIALWTMIRLAVWSAKTLERRQYGSSDK
jgi:hypothetical protein